MNNEHYKDYYHVFIVCISFYLRWNILSTQLNSVGLTNIVAVLYGGYKSP